MRKWIIVIFSTYCLAAVCDCLDEEHCEQVRMGIRNTASNAISECDLMARDLDDASRALNAEITDLNQGTIFVEHTWTNRDGAVFVTNIPVTVNTLQDGSQNNLVVNLYDALDGVQNAQASLVEVRADLSEIFDIADNLDCTICGNGGNSATNGTNCCCDLSPITIRLDEIIEHQRAIHLFCTNLNKFVVWVQQYTPTRYYLTTANSIDGWEDGVPRFKVVSNNQALDAGGNWFKDIQRALALTAKDQGLATSAAILIYNQLTNRVETKEEIQAHASNNVESVSSIDISSQTNLSITGAVTSLSFSAPAGSIFPNVDSSQCPQYFEIELPIPGASFDSPWGTERYRLSLSEVSYLFEFVRSCFRFIWWTVCAYIFYMIGGLIVRFISYLLKTINSITFGGGG